MIKKLNKNDDCTNPNVYHFFSFGFMIYHKKNVYQLKLTEMINMCNGINLKTQTVFFFLLKESKWY